MSWVDLCIDKANKLGLHAQQGVSPEGTSVVLENATERWAHKGPCHAMVSKEPVGKLSHSMFAGYVVRWYGVKTHRLAEDTKWHSTIDAALDDVVSRYKTEEAVWRLGG